LTRADRLNRYLERIRLGSPPATDLATLSALHYHHACAIPFENLDTLLGEQVSLDLDAITEKLVDRGRGGYCFEQNRLLQWALETIGFEPIPLAARVVWNRREGIENPRTHMALLVPLGDRRYLCDVGFGGATLTGPVELGPPDAQTTPHESARILEIPTGFVLELNIGDAWRGLYEFDLQPQTAADYEAMNHFVQTYPSSPFHQVLMAGKPDASGRSTLRGNGLRRYEAGRLVVDRAIESVEGLKEALSETFSLPLPDTSRLTDCLERIVAASGE